MNRDWPQSKQIKTFGNTKTPGLPRFLKPLKWMFISALNSGRRSEPHERQRISHFRGNQKTVVCYRIWICQRLALCSQRTANQTASTLRPKTVLKLTQLGFWNRKQRRAATEADQKLREHPDNGFVKAFQAGEMDVHLRTKLCLFFRPTRFARHNTSSSLPAHSSFRDLWLGRSL